MYFSWCYILSYSVKAHVLQFYFFLYMHACIWQCRYAQRSVNMCEKAAVFIIRQVSTMWSSDIKSPSRAVYWHELIRVFWVCFFVLFSSDIWNKVFLVLGYYNSCSSFYRWFAFLFCIFCSRYSMFLKWFLNMTWTELVMAKFWNQIHRLHENDDESFDVMLIFHIKCQIVKLCQRFQNDGESFYVMLILHTKCQIV